MGAVPLAHDEAPMSCRWRLLSGVSGLRERMRGRVVGKATGRCQSTSAGGVRSRIRTRTRAPAFHDVLEIGFDDLAAFIVVRDSSPRHGSRQASNAYLQGFIF